MDSVNPKIHTILRNVVWNIIFKDCKDISVINLTDSIRLKCKDDLQHNSYFENFSKIYPLKVTIEPSVYKKNHLYVSISIIEGTDLDAFLCLLRCQHKLTILDGALYIEDQ